MMTGKQMPMMPNPFEQDERYIIKQPRFKILKFLCKLFGHKYIHQPLNPYSWIFICKRCGKQRDIYEQGEQKNTEIKYFTKQDGKKVVKKKKRTKRKKGMKK